MKIYAICSPSHEVLRDTWFLPSAKEFFTEVVVETVPQDCPSGTYLKSGWAKFMGHKFDLLLRAVEENWGGTFTFSDVDIQFFDLPPSFIESLLEERDILFQRNSAKGDVCTGFFVCRANETMRNFWKAAKREVHEKWHAYDDQFIVNFLLGIAKFRLSPVRFFLMDIPWAEKMKGFFTEYLHRSKYNNASVRWGYLPKQFYTPGRLWAPGIQLDTPSDIILHHANWTSGVTNKIAQLEYVKSIVSGNRSNT